MTPDVMLMLSPSGNITLPFAADSSIRVYVSPLSLALPAIVVALVLLLLWSSKARPHGHKRSLSSGAREKGEGLKPIPEHSAQSYPPIEPLPDFDWETTEPRKSRPFKPKYNLTMSLENATISELIEMDKNYVERIQLRRQIMRDNPEIVLAATDMAKPAVDELYKWLLGTYLPTRFPRMFRLMGGAVSGQSDFYSMVTDERYSTVPPASPIRALQILGGLVEDDLLFLLPADDGDGYQLRAFVTCFPNGFNTSKKLNLKLRDIHTPVPGYKEKLEKSMDRWFDRLPVGKYVRRYNWTITTTDQLFTATGNHLYEGEEAVAVDVDICQARLRSERQMVHRLPESKAILFSFKTYLYPLSDIKDEGLGEQLAEAIDGFQSGNVPGMHFYKKAVVWGDSVKEYLRQ